MKLSMKLIFGFGVAAFLTAGVGVIGIYGISSVAGNVDKIGNERVPAIEGLGHMQKAYSDIGQAVKSLSIVELDYKKRKKIVADLDRYWRAYNDGRNIYAALPKDSEEENLWREYQTAFSSMKTEYNKLISLNSSIISKKIEDPMGIKWEVKARIVDHLYWMEHLTEAANTMSKFTGQLDPTQCGFGKWFYSYKTDSKVLKDVLAKIDEPHRVLHNMGSEINGLISEGRDVSANRLMLKSHEQADIVISLMNEVHKIADDEFIIIEKMQKLALGPMAAASSKAEDIIERLVNHSYSITDTFVSESADDASRTIWFTWIVVFVVLAAGIIMGIFIARSISLPVLRIAEDLASGSNQVASASGQITASSQSLAEGATEQASSLEETSSALEEMSAQTQANADNAREASELAEDTRRRADGGAETVAGMIGAMKDINSASAEISKIIKVIEEIAFQTNLLALNAAVEAARAGEHGKGFAVVAEEVRNLAQRAGAAAKETADLIENAVSKANAGSEMADQAGTALHEIVGGVQRVSGLIQEIAAASAEQAQGVSQVNNAVTQMDKVTQQNAAAAEEAAASAEELNAQADRLKENVVTLTAMVEGKSGGGNISGSSVSPAKPRQKSLPAPRKAFASSPPPQTRRAYTPPPPAASAPSAPAKKMDNHDDIIPMDDDFDDF